MQVEWVFSASQIDTYELCPRKWAWRYIDDLPTTPNAAAQLGTDVHNTLEKWLRNKIPPQVADPAGKIAAAMLPFLPPPQAVKAEYVERRFQVTLGDYHFVGYMDLVMPEGPVVYDHKTTSDFRWAKSAEDLIDDVQATLYGYWGFIHFPNVIQVSLQWTYGRTRGAAMVQPVKRQVTRGDIEPRLLKTIQSAGEMLLIKRNVESAIEVPYEASACEAFGGCPFKDKCNLTAAERMNAIMTQGSAKEGFLAKLQARKAAAVGAGTNGTAINPPEQHASAPVSETAPTAPAPAAAPAAVPGRRRGRPPKTAAEQAAALPAPTSAPTRTVAEAEAGRWTLYIDCAPTKLPGGGYPASADKYLDPVPGTDGEEMGPDEFLAVVQGRLGALPPAAGVVLLTSKESHLNALLAFMQEAMTVVDARSVR
jgi:hypothetical protein